jgi:uncharacterized repeat protein (TIGR03847 family)
VARSVFLFDPPERFVVGTVGEPGERAFYLQASEGARVISVAVEKEQASLLAEKITELLEEVSRRHPEFALGAADEPLEDLEPLQQPILEEFRVGALGLGWNAMTNRVVVEAHSAEADEVPEIEDDSDPDSPDCLRVRLTAQVAGTFARRAAAVVSAGRPPCPFCHLPLNPSGHICPRANGYRR